MDESTAGLGQVARRTSPADMVMAAGAGSRNSIYEKGQEAERWEVKDEGLWVKHGILHRNNLNVKQNKRMVKE